jgi:hypothetical protein
LQILQLPLVSLVVQQQWRYVRIWFGPRIATLSQVTLEVAAVLIFGVYAYWFFVYPTPHRSQ